MQSYFTSIPAAVFTAIAIFIVKELLEFLRRRRADKRRLAVYKNILADECERNRWCTKSMRSIAKTVTKEPRMYMVRNEPSGRTLFLTPDEDGDFSSGGILPVVHREKIEKLAPDIAQLDEALSKEVREALDALAELEHVRNSVIDYEKPDSRADVAAFYESFWDYVKEELDDADKQIEALYLACTGKKLENHRLR